MIKLSQDELNLLEIYSIYSFYQIKQFFYEWSAAYALNNKGRLSIEPEQRIGVTKKSRVFLCGETDETTKKGF